MLLEEIFPEKLKVGLIVLNHKKYSFLNIENQRPIIFLSIFSKIFEKFIVNRLLNYLNA